MTANHNWTTTRLYRFAKLLKRGAGALLALQLFIALLRTIVGLSIMPIIRLFQDPWFWIFFVVALAGVILQWVSILRSTTADE